MEEGQTCTYSKCDFEDLSIEVMGYFTCIRGFLWGEPSCLNYEAKYWAVTWVLPKIVGAFDFKGTFLRTVNMSNDTISSFEANVSKSLADCLVTADVSHFVTFEVRHLWESKDKYDEDTGLLVSEYRTHWFSVYYELLVWDVNKLAANEDVLVRLLSSGSDIVNYFSTLMYARANITLTELFPTNFPITYNTSVVAPDTEVATATIHRIDARLVIMLIVGPRFLHHFFRGHVRE